MYTLGMDTIAGSKLLQLRFGRFGAFQPDQAVMHGDRRARFIRVSDGNAIIRHWGESDPVAVPPEALSLPPENLRHAAERAPVGRNVPRPQGRGEVGWLTRHHPRRRHRLRP